MGATSTPGPMGGERWLGDYRAAASRRLEAGESAELLARLRREVRALRRAQAFAQAAALLVTLVAGTFFALRPDPLGPIVTVFAAIGAALLALGPVGALMEIVWGPRRWSRPLFLGAVALFALGSWLEQSRGHRGCLGWVLAWSFLTLVFGGGACFYLRWRSRRARLRELAAAALDAERGEVQVFELVEDGAREPGPEDVAAAEPDTPRQLEVLPLSKLVYSADGRLVSELLPAPVVETGLVAGPSTSPEGSSSSHRSFSDSEGRELRAAHRRLRRAALGRVGFAIWGAAVLLRLAENAARGAHDPGLSGVGWLCASGVGLAVAAERWWFLRRLAADLQAGQVRRGVIMEGARLRAVEDLEASGLVWSVDGIPAPWRRGHEA